MIEKRIAGVLLSGAAFLLVEVRFEHREVLGETWRGWIPWRSRDSACSACSSAPPAARASDEGRRRGNIRGAIRVTAHEGAAMTGAAKFGDFERTIGPHMGAAYNLARWLLRESADAEDVLQEAFMRAFRYFDTFHGERARSWLLAIVRNTCWSFIARRGEPE